MRLDAETKLLGLLGSPVRQSLSPAMHNAAFEALKLNFCYLAFDVKHSELATILKALVPLGFDGVNVKAVALALLKSGVNSLAIFNRSYSRA